MYCYVTEWTKWVLHLHVTIYLQKNKFAFKIIADFVTLVLFPPTVHSMISTITFTWWQMYFSMWVLWSIPSFTIWSRPNTGKYFFPLPLTFARRTLKARGLTRAKGAYNYHSTFVHLWSQPVTANRPFIPWWSWRLCTDVNSVWTFRLVDYKCICCCFVPSVLRDHA